MDRKPLYLVLIDAIEVLPRLFGHVLIPEIVGAELNRPSAPLAVGEWLANAPAWLETRATLPASAKLPPHLGAGERAAISTTAPESRAHGIKATGTLGVMIQAARSGLLDLQAAFGRLELTNFRYRRELLDALLAQHEGRKL